MCAIDLDPLDPVPQDELFVLRFLLTHKSIEAAAEALRNTVRWRKGRHDFNRDAHASLVGSVPGKAQVVTDNMLRVGRWWPGFLHHYTPHLEPVTVIRSGLAYPRALADADMMETMFEGMAQYKEANYYICDKNSRHTGRLCKTFCVTAHSRSAFRL